MATKWSEKQIQLDYTVFWLRSLGRRYNLQDLGKRYCFIKNNISSVNITLKGLGEAVQIESRKCLLLI